MNPPTPTLPNCQALCRHCLVAVAATTVALGLAPPLSAAGDPLGTAIGQVAAGGGSSSMAVSPVEADRLRNLVERGARLEDAAGVPRDFAKAYALYCEAARLRSLDALMRMGWMYARGRGRARDEAIANTLFRRAAGAPAEQHDRMPDCLRPPYRIIEVAEPAPEFRETPPHAPARPAGPPVAPLSAGLTPEARKLTRTVVSMAREFRLDPRLVLAVMRIESNFDPQARSPQNAQGLMQLIPATAERFAVRNAFDPVQNLRGGMRYLRWLLAYFRGDVVLALAAYNAGEGAVDRHRGVPPYPETLAYLRRIRALYPHDRHPFDAQVATPSPWMSQRNATIPSRPQELVTTD